jgi:hypothetical protein
MKCTTLTDIDSRRNTERKHTKGLIDSHPNAPPAKDDRANNDGLLQIYDSSCGPAAVEVLRAEADPMFAFAVHAWGGPQALIRPGLADQVERAWLMHVGDTPRRRRGMHDYLRLKEACGDLVQSRALGGHERLAVLRYCRTAEAELTGAARSGLAVLHRHGRFPTEREVERMRAALPATPSTGTDDKQMAKIVATGVGSVTGVRFHHRHLGSVVGARRRPGPVERPGVSRPRSLDRHHRLGAGGGLRRRVVPTDALRLAGSRGLGLRDRSGKRPTRRLSPTVIGFARAFPESFTPPFNLRG